MMEVTVQNGRYSVILGFSEPQNTMCLPFSISKVFQILSYYRKKTERKITSVCSVVSNYNFSFLISVLNFLLQTYY